MPWPFTDISGRLSLRIKLLEVQCESRTLDRVFTTITTTVSYRTIAERSYDAYYRLSDPRSQIRSYVYDVVRSTLPTLTLDEVFARKGTVAEEVEGRLGGAMAEYGYEILGCMVTDLRPCEEVVVGMGEVHVARRLKVAMAYKAEAAKIKLVKEAEANSESLYLSGVGTAGQRKALAHELKKGFRDRFDAGGTSVKDVVNILLLTQYLDTMVTVSGSSGGEDSMILGTDPGILIDLQKQLRALDS